MGSSNTEVTDDSATISDDEGATTETDVDVNADDSRDEAAVDSSPFQEGERVLAFHNQHLYEAKVQKVELDMKAWKYYVHYLGWNKSWDEWVGVDRLMKKTEENIWKQKELNKKEGMDKHVMLGRTSQMKPKITTVGRGKKRKHGPDQKDKSVGNPEKQVNVQIPPMLKKQLVDDYEAVTHLGKLVKLPCSPNVAEILSKYRDYQTRKGAMIADTVEEIVNGLRCYFDKALPAMLLYKNERQQYREAGGDNTSPSLIYGAEHLLRLFVKLPEILYHANIEEVTLMELRQYLLDFLKFLQKHQSTFFHSAYHSPEDRDMTAKKQERVR